MNKPEMHPHKPGSRVARRVAAEAKRQAEAVKRQAETIALRASMGLEWIVIVRFASGAHDVRLHKVSQPMPERYSEARASIRERWNLPAMRYVTAERLAESLRASLDQNRRERGDARRVARRA